MTAINQVNGVGPALERALAAMGISTVEALASASPESLQAVPRVGSRRAEQLVAAARAMLTGATPGPVPAPELANGVPVAVDAPAEDPGAAKKTAKKPKKKKPAKAAKAKAEKQAKSDKKTSKKDKKKKADKKKAGKSKKKSRKAKGKSGKSKKK